MRILLIEDDRATADYIAKGLQEIGHIVQVARTGRDGMLLAAGEAWDVIVTDRMLPGPDGLTILRTLRASGITTPVLVLTALGEVERRVEGLDAGADDYLVKPFELKELHARIIANIRRNQQQEGPVLSYGPLRLELTTRRAFREGKELRLSPTEISLLELFIRHENQVLSRKMLYHQLWESDWESETNVIEVHINRLRSKVDRGFSRALIHTIRGRGYMLSENPPQGPRSAEDAVPESQDPLASHSA